MCIILKPAEVHNTQILVAPNHNNTRQLVIYGNRVETKENHNAMILPVPHASTLKLHDISQYDKLFDDCSKCFSKDYDVDSYSNFSYSASNQRSLPVIKYGSYDLSIVPKYQDFDQLDQMFNIKSNIVSKILKKYYQNFGFLVCKLRTNSSDKYHPIAYSHQIYQTNIMFVPTRHHHDIKEETHSDYDHEIYSINTKSLCGSYKWNYTFKLKTDLIPDFNFPTINTFNKLVIKEHTKNTDLYFYLESHISPNAYGVDGCVFRSNNPAITFKNKGSIYITPLFRGLNFYAERPKLNTFMYPLSESNHPISFAGTGTTFIVDSNRILVTDDVGTPQEHQLIFEFNPLNESSTPGVYLFSTNATKPSEQNLQSRLMNVIERSH